jgi:alkanesulfonate monooxygenase SsuD/methylene tetrahydromethanopterin reductase-like flavin-dependent oxidoreductase (luciferase family)
MKLGIYLNAQHPQADDPARRFAETVEQARLIRSLGFDSIWGGEHHATPGFHYFPLLPMLQRLAAEVPGLEIGTNLVLLPLHNPVEIAEVGAFLDVITGRALPARGRARLPSRGVRDLRGADGGAGEPLTEAIEIIRRLWTEDKVTHRGRAGRSRA